MDKILFSPMFKPRATHWHRVFLSTPINHLIPRWPKVSLSTPINHFIPLPTKANPNTAREYERLRRETKRN